MEEKTLKVLRQFFSISIAAFDMQIAIAKAFGNECHKSYMHILHLECKKELDKENPDPKIIDYYLSMMEKIAKKINQLKQ